MVRIPPQYPDLLTWVSRTQDGVDEWGQPNYVEVVGEVYGRYENFKGSKKEFLDVDGITIIHNDGVFFCDEGVEFPPRFSECIVRDLKFQVIHTYNGFFNTTIYLKEVK